MRFKTFSWPLEVGAPLFLGLPLNEIEIEEATKLEEVFSKENILIAISGLNGDKSPGQMVSL